MREKRICSPAYFQPSIILPTPNICPRDISQRNHQQTLAFLRIRSCCHLQLKVCSSFTLLFHFCSLFLQPTQLSSRCISECGSLLYLCICIYLDYVHMSYNSCITLMLKLGKWMWIKISANCFSFSMREIHGEWNDRKPFEPSVDPLFALITFKSSLNL